MARTTVLPVTRATRSPTRDATGSVNLYDRCRLGDESAWAEVYARAIAAVKRCRVSQAEAEDIAGDAVLKLVKVVRAGKVKDPVAFPAYVGVVAVRLFYDRRRSPDQRDRVWNEPDETGLTILERAVDPDPDPAKVASVRERFAALLAALGRLPAACQTVLRAYFQHIHLDAGGSYRTLERALRSNRGTIASRVTRCMDELLDDESLRNLLEARP